MGFTFNWIETIMECITSISYSVIINGFKWENFQATRGLHQGDPLSPFMFLICGEGLSCLMHLAMSEGLLRGVKASRSDDCILFSETTSRGANVLKEILRKYRMCSGQCVNFDKSTVFFSKNTSEVEKRVVVNILGVRSLNDPKRYLRLPNMIESSSKLITGVRDIYRNEGMKYLLSLFYKGSQLTQWPVSFYLRRYVLRLRILLPSFGGKRDTEKGVYTGVSGGTFVF
ncbi:reverse transcriptase [Gossypium australe]|uniref:Reverse transcriptase n=1 Tax=Gossypium australe TaxID=47621 RepID=A0A5B6VEK3_9ROSI|nr:reverse transcriptase [Gossypium australe]